MKRLSLILIFLFCIAIAGCAASGAPHETDIASVTSGKPLVTPSLIPDTSSGMAIPEGFVKNEAGATEAEVSAIFAVEERSYNIESISGQDIYLYIYARQDWHDGALLLAGVSPMGEIAPELYFVSNGAAVMRTSGADVWSINYTHYQGETIVFGPSFAWDNGPLATDEVRAEFWNGESVMVPMPYTPNGETDVSRGYICGTSSITWLKSLKIMADGEVVADDSSGQFITDPENQPWYGEAESIRNRTCFVPMMDTMPDDSIGVVDFFGGISCVTLETPNEGGSTETSPLKYWPGCEAHEGISPDIWHSNNGLGAVEVVAGSPITAEVIAVSDSFDAQDKIADLSVSHAYWVDLSILDDEQCIREGELVCPTGKGFYVLIVDTDYGYFSQMVKVV